MVPSGIQLRCHRNNCTFWAASGIKNTLNTQEKRHADSQTKHDFHDSQNRDTTEETFCQLSATRRGAVLEWCTSDFREDKTTTRSRSTETVALRAFERTALPSESSKTGFVKARSSAKCGATETTRVSSLRCHRTRLRLDDTQKAHGQSLTNALPMQQWNNGNQAN